MDVLLIHLPSCSTTPGPAPPRSNHARHPTRLHILIYFIRRWDGNWPSIAYPRPTAHAQLDQRCGFLRSHHSSWDPARGKPSANGLAALTGITSAGVAPVAHVQVRRWRLAKRAGAGKLQRANMSLLEGAYCCICTSAPWAQPRVMAPDRRPSGCPATAQGASEAVSAARDSLAMLAYSAHRELIARVDYPWRRRAHDHLLLWTPAPCPVQPWHFS